MEKLTNKEFWILWRHRNGKPFDLSFDNCYYLSEYQYISGSDVPSSNPEKYKMSVKVFVTRDGIHAAEHHKDSYFEARWTSFRAWLSLGVSVVALIVSILRLIA